MSRFCKDCVHFSPAVGGFEQLKMLHGKCYLTSTQKLNLVSGQVEQAFASNNRADASKCGPDATWFERDSKENDLRQEIAASGDC